MLALTTGRDKRLRSDHDFFLKLCIELDLFVLQALHLFLVQLVPLEVLAEQIVLYDLPLLGQLHAVFEPLVELLELCIELGLALRGKIRTPWLNTQALVSDIKISKKLLDALLTKLVSKGLTAASRCVCTLLARLLERLHVLSDFGWRLDLCRATVSLGFLLLG